MSTASDPATWVASHGDALYKYALLRMRNPSVAEDLVQETFLAALKAHQRFAGQSSERTWLIGILKHKIIDHFRKHRAEQQVDEIESVADRVEEAFNQHGHWNTELKEWSNPSHALEQKEFWAILSECITHLPTHLADLYILREMKEIGSEEICKLLGISTTNNMWVMLSRARMRLRKCLETRWFGASEGV